MHAACCRRRSNPLVRLAAPSTRRGRCWIARSARRKSSPIAPLANRSRPTTRTCPASCPMRWCSLPLPMTLRAFWKLPSGPRCPSRRAWPARDERAAPCPCAGGIVLVTLGMASIKEIDRADRVAVVEPGVITGDLHDAVEKEGLFYPPDPNSLKMCAIGGNVAENAGGPRAFKYGVTRDYVLGLEAVLMGGHADSHRQAHGEGRHRLRRHRAARRQRRHARRLQRGHAAAHPQAARGGDAARAFRRRTQRCCCGLATSWPRGSSPRCIELLDAGTLAAVRTRGVAVDERAGAMLLIEVDGDVRACEEEATQRRRRVHASAGPRRARRARRGAARAPVGGAARDVARGARARPIQALRGHRRARGGASPTCSTKSQRTSAKNRHPHADLRPRRRRQPPRELSLGPSRRSAARQAKSIEQLFRDVIAMRGTLSGEHGIGVLKAPYLPLEQSPALIELQRKLKAVVRSEGSAQPGQDLSRREGIARADAYWASTPARGTWAGGCSSATARAWCTSRTASSTPTWTRPIAERLCQIERELQAVVEHFRPTAASVEALFFAKDASAAAKLGHARGVALLVLARAGLPIAEYPPARVKRAIVGNGRADKHQVAMVMASSRPGRAAASGRGRRACHCAHPRQRRGLRRALVDRGGQSPLARGGSRAHPAEMTVQSDA